MPWLRAYVDIAQIGEHSRVIDFEVEPGDYELGTGESDRGVVRLTASGRKKLKLKKNEECNNFAELTFGADQANI